LEYEASHQTGSHIRLTTRRRGEHHITIPAHDALKVGTLAAILRDVEQHHDLGRQDLLQKLFS
jgi:predicted RNA binding protein YcfA (HicA-like mRNA interferase family)